MGPIFWWSVRKWKSLTTPTIRLSPKLEKRQGGFVDEVTAPQIGLSLPGKVSAVKELEAQDIDEIRVGLHDDHRLLLSVDGPGVGVGQGSRGLADEGDAPDVRALKKALLEDAFGLTEDLSLPEPGPEDLERFLEFPFQRDEEDLLPVVPEAP
jgi:hypothetical protein